MEASTQDPAPEQIADATRNSSQLFRYSAWIHEGHGAADCPQAETSCEDPQHFHAWCRLPNQLQHQDIRERAMAAKARRLRQLRDPESDAHVVLEADLAEICHDRAAMIDELVSQDWWKRHLEAMSDLEQQEDYKFIERDRARLAELKELEPDARPADEYAELERHFTAYGDALEKRRDELEKPVREATESLEDGEMLEQVREVRINYEAGQAFMDDYSKWEWFSGTYRTADPITRRRRFESLEELADAAPEIVDALRRTFGDLEAALRRGPQGN